MTAIKANASSVPPVGKEENSAQRPKLSPPSSSEDEAKSRFVSALSCGVHSLIARGHGRAKASAALLNEISDGCSPDEDEVFQTMECLGISLEDATKVMTVSTAFRKAHTTAKGGAIEAIDELTTRLNLAEIGHRNGSSSRSASPPLMPSTPSNAKLSELTRNESVESCLSQTRSSSSTNSSAMAKKCQRPNNRAKPSTQLQQHHQRGRKRALTEKTPEKRDTNVMIDEEKMLNAKLSTKVAAAAAAAAAGSEGKKQQGTKPSSVAARATSPEGAARGKRTAVALLNVEESEANKRPRTRSQTEESIPELGI